VDRPQARIFADASVLIGLSRIGRLDLLEILGLPIAATPGVWTEVTRRRDRPGVDALERLLTDGGLTIVTTGDRADYPHLGRGEAETLSAARQVGAGVLVDERQARQLLIRDPELSAAIPSTITTIGVVVLAKRLGVVTSAQPILDALIAQSFRIGQSTYEAALRSVDEWPPV
jgi:predicted nucleic acid-binding protein